MHRAPSAKLFTYLRKKQSASNPKTGFKIVFKPQANRMDTTAHMDCAHQLQSLQMKQTMLYGTLQTWLLLYNELEPRNATNFFATIWRQWGVPHPCLLPVTHFHSHGLYKSVTSLFRVLYPHSVFTTSPGAYQEMKDCGK